jgi:hypothetical protein
MFGFASGAFVGLSGALPVSASPLPEIGYRLGVVFLASSIPALTMAPIGGVILQNSANGWLDVKIFGASCASQGRRLFWYRGYSILRRNFSRCFECEVAHSSNCWNMQRGLGGLLWCDTVRSRARGTVRGHVLTHPPHTT